MDTFYDRDGITVHHGDALDMLAELPDESVDPVVTDPPYSLSFMGRSWDTHDTPLGFQTWCNQWTAECLRVLKPGGHLLAFGSSRTYHRMTCGVEDAGFEIRDCITWHFGSGFPKSHNVSAALDRIVPPDARCVCVPHSTRTTPDSPGDYPSSHGFDDGQPHQAEAGDRSPAPSPGDALARTRGGLPRGGRVVEPASTDPGAGNGHPSIAGSPLQSGSPSGVGQPSAFVQSDTQTSTSAAPEQEPHRTDSRTQHTSGSAAGSASSSSWRNQYMACRECGGFVTPQGLGTALKPATEFIVVARKPLGGAIHVRARVEHELRQRGAEEIAWSRSAASGAESGSRTASSGSTEPQPTAATSARTASDSGTPPTGSETARRTARPGDAGAQQTQSTTEPRGDGASVHSGPKSSPRTEAPAPAAVNDATYSSRSITSTVGEPRTEGLPGERSMPRSSERDSRTVTESFAGIATGLTDWATVHIDRLADGTYVWPEGLPERVTSGSTVAANVLAHGTGALNIDGARVGMSDADRAVINNMGGFGSAGWDNSASVGSGVLEGRNDGSLQSLGAKAHDGGRWPANVILDESQSRALDEQSGTSVSKAGGASGTHFSAGEPGTPTPDRPRGGHTDSGGASRFFYTAKADAAERPKVNGTAHPTVKPLSLMRWLVRLVTPPGGTVLEPFAGSGTTVEACIIEGLRCVAIEREADYLPLIEARISRRRDPARAVELAGEDMGLLGLLGEETA